MNRIKELRKAKGINQTQLAHEIGISPRHVYFLERGSRNPSITVALKISELLGAPVNDIFMKQKEVR